MYVPFSTSFGKYKMVQKIAQQAYRLWCRTLIFGLIAVVIVSHLTASVVFPLVIAFGPTETWDGRIHVIILAIAIFCLCFACLPALSGDTIKDYAESKYGADRTSYHDKLERAAIKMQRFSSCLGLAGLQFLALAFLFLFARVIYWVL